MPVFYDIITEPVQVDSIGIDSLGYHFDFDTFIITPSDLPADQTGDLNDIITGYNAGGLLAGPSLTIDGYYFIEGDVNAKIKEITNESINSICEAINEKNRRNYESFEKKNAVSLYLDQKKTELEKGGKLNLQFCYMYKDIDPIEFRRYDSAVASIVNIITLEDGKKYYNYIFQPSERNAEFSLVHLLHSLR